MTQHRPASSTHLLFSPVFHYLAVSLLLLPFFHLFFSQQKFIVRWSILTVCLFTSLSFVWLAKWRGRSSKSKDEKLPHSNPSTRATMIERHIGRPLVVDPDMPYIGYLKPDEWRKYTLPEGIGVGRGSRGKQRNKFEEETKKDTKVGVEKTKQGKHNDVDPNQLFFDIALDDGVNTEVRVEGDVGHIAENMEEEDYGMEKDEEKEVEEEEVGSEMEDGDGREQSNLV